MNKHQTAANAARISKDMMNRAIDDAISIVNIGGRDGILPAKNVTDYVNKCFDDAERDLQIARKALLEGV